VRERPSHLDGVRVEPDSRRHLSPDRPLGIGPVEKLFGILDVARDEQRHGQVLVQQQAHCHAGDVGQANARPQRTDGGRGVAGHKVCLGEDGQVVAAILGTANLGRRIHDLFDQVASLVEASEREQHLGADTVRVGDARPVAEL
jgi:hypothetical protein